MLAFLRYRLGFDFSIRPTPEPPPLPTLPNDPDQPSLPTPEFTVVPAPTPP